jgi:hypothetical protein
MGVQPGGPHSSPRRPPTGSQTVPGSARSRASGLSRFVCLELLAAGTGRAPPRVNVGDVEPEVIPPGLCPPVRNKHVEQRSGGRGCSAQLQEGKTPRRLPLWAVQLVPFRVLRADNVFRVTFTWRLTSMPQRRAGVPPTLQRGPAPTPRVGSAHRRSIVQIPPKGVLCHEQNMGRGGIRSHSLQVGVARSSRWVR